MLEVSLHDDIKEIRLARAPVNALNDALIGALLEQFAPEALATARAVVLSGQRGVFTAGLDLRALTEPGAIDYRAFARRFFTLQQRIASSPVPVIAALTGHSPAGGAVLALYCDRRVMATGDFRIGLNEVQVGLTPGPIIAQACRRLVGARAAERLLTTGALLTPSEALALGLVDRLAAPDQVVATALAEARELLRLPAHAYALTRSIVRADLVAMFGTDPQATIEAQALEFETLMHSDETRERLAAALAARR